MVIANVTPDGRIEVIDRVKEMVRLGQQRLHHRAAVRGDDGAGEPRAQDLRPPRPRAAGRAPARRRDQRRARGAQRRALRRAAAARDGAADRDHLRTGGGAAHLPRHAATRSGSTAARISWSTSGAAASSCRSRSDGRPLWMRSLPLGVARLTQQFLTKDPPSAGQIRSLERHLEHELDDLLDARAARRRGAGDRDVGHRAHAGGDGAGGARGRCAAAARRGRHCRAADAPAPARPVARRRGARRDAGDGRQAGRPHAGRRHPAGHHPVACRRSRPGRVLVGAARGRAARSRARAGRAGTGVADGAPAQRAVARHALRRHQRARPSGGDARAPALRHARAGPRPAARRPASCSSTRRCCTTSGTPSSTTATSGTPTTSIRASELLGFSPVEIEMIALVARGHRKQAPRLSDPEMQSAARRRTAGWCAGWRRCCGWPTRSTAPISV